MSGTPEPLRPPDPATEDIGPIVQRPQPAAPSPFPVPPLFGKYPYEGLEVHDVGLLPYLYLHPVYSPHSEGRLSGKPFLKTRMHLVERLANHLMKGGKFTGKKSKALATVRKAFDELAAKEGKNPLQLLVDAGRERVSPRGGHPPSVRRDQRSARRRRLSRPPAQRRDPQPRPGRDHGLAQVHQTDPYLPRGRDQLGRQGQPHQLRRRPQGRSRARRAVGALRARRDPQS